MGTLILILMVICYEKEGNSNEEQQKHTETFN